MNFNSPFQGSTVSHQPFSGLPKHSKRRHFHKTVEGGGVKPHTKEPMKLIGCPNSKLECLQIFDFKHNPLKLVALACFPCSEMLSKILQDENGTVQDSCNSTGSKVIQHIFQVDTLIFHCNVFFWECHWHLHTMKGFMHINWRNYLNSWIQISSGKFSSWSHVFVQMPKSETSSQLFCQKETWKANFGCQKFGDIVQAIDFLGVFPCFWPFPSVTWNVSIIVQVWMFVSWHWSQHLKPKAFKAIHWNGREIRNDNKLSEIKNIFENFGHSHPSSLAFTRAAPLVPHSGNNVLNQKNLPEMGHRNFMKMCHWNSWKLPFTVLKCWTKYFKVRFKMFRIMHWCALSWKVGLDWENKIFSRALTLRNATFFFCGQQMTIVCMHVERCQLHQWTCWHLVSIKLAQCCEQTWGDPHVCMHAHFHFSNSRRVLENNQLGQESEQRKKLVGPHLLLRTNAPRHKFFFKSSKRSLWTNLCRSDKWNVPARREQMQGVAPSSQHEHWPTFKLAVVKSHICGRWATIVCLVSGSFPMTEQIWWKREYQGRATQNWKTCELSRMHGHAKFCKSSIYRPHVWPCISQSCPLFNAWPPNWCAASEKVHVCFHFSPACRQILLICFVASVLGTWMQAFLWVHPAGAHLWGSLQNCDGHFWPIFTRHRGDRQHHGEKKETISGFDPSELFQLSNSINIQCGKIFLKTFMRNFSSAKCSQHSGSWTSPIDICHQIDQLLKCLMSSIIFEFRTSETKPTRGKFVLSTCCSKWPTTLFEAEIVVNHLDFSFSGTHKFRSLWHFV